MNQRCIQAAIVFLCFFVFQSLAIEWESSKEKINFHILNSETSSDPFNLLSEEDLLKEWSFEEKDGLLEKIELLKHSFEEQIYIDVKLIGLNGAGSVTPSEVEAKLTKNLGAMVYDDSYGVISSASGTRKLNIRKKFSFKVSRLERLASELTNAVSEKLKEDSLFVPYTAVDNIIRENFAISPATSYTIYIFALNISAEKPYRFTQFEEIDSLTIEQCPTTVWAGKERYAWIDITKEPPLYGPLLFGEGTIASSNMPFMKKYKTSASLAVDLASLLHRTAQYLLSPSMYYFPIPYRKNTEFVLIRIREKESQLVDFNWEFFQNQILSIPRLYQQEVSFRVMDFAMSKCPVCNLALKNARQTMYNVYADWNEKQLIKYFDSKELYYWMSRHIRILDPLYNPSTTIPIFLFDFEDPTTLLLDRDLQAVSFSDMVLAIQTKAPNPITTDYGCDAETLVVNPSDALRSTLAATLQTAWGISPTYLRSSSVHSKPQEDHLWSLGHTPFAPFSPSSQLSFSIKDAAPKHVIYTQLHNTFQELNDLFTHFADYDKEVHEVLSPSDHLQFVRRWNMFQHKMGEARRHLSLQNFNQSFLFAESMIHDVQALHKLIHLAGKNLHTYFYCEVKNSSQTLDYVKWGFSISPIVMVSIALVYFLRKALRPKMKDV